MSGTAGDGAGREDGGTDVGGEASTSLGEVLLDQTGAVRQAALDGGFHVLPPDCFTSGRLGANEVPFITAATQRAFHEGYPQRPVDRLARACPGQPAAMSGALVDAEAAVLLNAREGHFALESGLHGTLWLDLDTTSSRPDRLLPLAGRIADLLTPHRPEIVCGPLVGGALLGQLVAATAGLRLTPPRRERAALPAGAGSAPARARRPTGPDLEPRPVPAVPAGLTARRLKSHFRPDGDSPVVAEGCAVVHRSSFPLDAVAALAGKYGGWDATDEAPHGPRVLLEVPVTRWLLTGTAQ